MPTELWRVLLLVHPTIGLASVVFAAWVGSLGLRGRLPASQATRQRAAHVRWAPRVLGAAVTTWATGLATVRWLRDDLEAAASRHFQVGTGIVFLFAGAALLSRRIEESSAARRTHPWLGAAAVLLGGVQVFLGLEIMPH